MNCDNTSRFVNSQKKQHSVCQRLTDGNYLFCSNRYRWTKDGEDFIPPHITTNKTDPTGGTVVLLNKHLINFQGKYRCYAFNKLGTAMTEEIELIAPSEYNFQKKLIYILTID